MKGTKTLSLLVLPILLLSCHTKTGLQADKLLTKTFQPGEIRGLQCLLNYTDSMVRAKTSEPETAKAYQKLFDKIATTIRDSSKLEAPFPEEEKYAFLNTLDSTVFQAIYVMDTHSDKLIVRDQILTNVDNFPQLRINPSGKYINYLNKLGETDPFFSSLHDQIKFSGDLPPVGVLWFPAAGKQFDVNDVPYHLWAAIYLLRLEDPVYMKLRRYLTAS